MNPISRLLSKLVILAGALFTTACSTGPAFGPSVIAATNGLDGDTAPATLASCPQSPNCVSSVATEADKKVAAFSLSGKSAAEFQTLLVSSIEADGGVVRNSRTGYVWATYTSSVFRFVDDIEWLLDSNEGVYQVRSASRTGYSDLGVNLKRVERLRAAIKQ